MVATLGRRFFTPKPGENVLRNWTRTDTFARWAQYIPAVIFGRVIQVSADGKEVQQLNPSRIKFLLPLALLGGAAVYFGLQKIALIAAAVMVTASIIGIVVMARSEAQKEYNDAYVKFVVEQRQSGKLTDKASLAEEVNVYAKQLAKEANSGWFQGDVTGALEAFQAQCAKGTTTLVQHLLTVDEKVFAAVYKQAGNFLMEKMTSREMATAVMAEVVKAAPRSDAETEQIARFQTFIERFARRGEVYSKTDWTSEICDAVQGNPVALAGVLTGLTAKKGSIGEAMARGFTVSVLGQVIDRGRLPIATLGALAVELSAKATDPKFSGYADLLSRCEARLSDAINGLKHVAGYEGRSTPQTEAFLELKDASVQAKWIQLSLGAHWLGELAGEVSLDVVTRGLSGDLAAVDATFLTTVLERLVKEGSKQQAEAVVNLANTSTLQNWAGFGQSLSDKQIALVQMLRVKHNLDADTLDLAVSTNPAQYVPALLKCSEGSVQQMIWKTFVAQGVYPEPAGLHEEDDIKAFFGALPGSFKAAVNKVPADHQASIQRLVGAAEFLLKARNKTAMDAFVGGLDNGQKAILGHHLSAQEQVESGLAKRFTQSLEEWKALGSVGPATAWSAYTASGYVE